MKKTRELLMSDYDTVNQALSLIKPEEERYGNLLKEKDNIRNELIKIDSIDAEVKNEKGKLESEEKREKIRNAITIGTFTVSTMVSLYGIIRTFRFDEQGTVTSTLGRSILSNTVPKIFKR